MLTKNVPFGDRFAEWNIHIWITLNKYEYRRWRQKVAGYSFGRNSLQTEHFQFHRFLFNLIFFSSMAFWNLLSILKLYRTVVYILLIVMQPIVFLITVSEFRNATEMSSCKFTLGNILSYRCILFSKPLVFWLNHICCFPNHYRGFIDVWFASNRIRAIDIL